MRPQMPPAALTAANNASTPWEPWGKDPVSGPGHAAHVAEVDGRRSDARVRGRVAGTAGAVRRLRSGGEVEAGRGRGPALPSARPQPPGWHLGRRGPGHGMSGAAPTTRRTIPSPPSAVVVPPATAAVVVVVAATAACWDPRRRWRPRQIGGSPVAPHEVATKAKTSAPTRCPRRFLAHQILPPVLGTQGNPFR